jgi:rare lipoprotein A
VWLAINVVITIVLAPALFPGHHTGNSVAVRAGVGNFPFHATSAGARDDVVIWRAAAIDDTPSTTTTTVPPTTIPPTTAAPRPRVHVAAAPSTTTTTAKPKPRPTTTTTSTTAAPSQNESGKATYYDTGSPGVCAHKTLPFGTVVTVTNLANGKSVTCTVHDRGPYVDGYIIDLNPQEFGKIAPLSAGVINARITW